MTTLSKTSTTVPTASPATSPATAPPAVAQSTPLARNERPIAWAGLRLFIAALAFPAMKLLGWAIKPAFVLYALLCAQGAASPEMPLWCIPALLPSLPSDMALTAVASVAAISLAALIVDFCLACFHARTRLPGFWWLLALLSSLALYYAGSNLEGFFASFKLL